MIKALLADDEALVRRAIRLRIDWSALGMQLVGEASDGTEAWECVRAHQPDLVLTDIRMAGLDGLSLLERIHSEYPRTRVILISGFSDFDYARQALRLGAMDYLVKPIKPELLHKTLCRAAREITSERLQVRQATVAMAKELLLTTKQPAVDDGSDCAGLHDRHWVICLAVVGNFAAGSDGLAGEDTARLLSAFETLAQPHLPADNLLVLGALASPTEICFLLGYATSLATDTVQQRALAVAEAVQEWTAGQLRCAVTLGLSRPVSPGSFAEAFGEVRQLVRSEFILGRGQILPIWAGTAGFPAMSPLSADQRHLVSAALESDNRETLERVLHGLWTESDKLVEDKLETLHIKLASVFGILERVMSDNGLHLAEVVGGSVTQRNLAESAESPADLRRQVREIVQQALVHLDKQSDGVTHRTVGAAREYITHYFFRDISLFDLAQRYHLNSNYFSQCFKAVTGKTFIRFLTEVRVARACELLGTTPLKMHQIAEMVGYRDYRYFTQVFRREMGMTPDQFRKGTGGQLESEGDEPQRNEG